MKKRFVLGLMILCVIVQVFAVENKKFQFDFLPESSLYPTHVADPYSFTTGIEYQKMSTDKPFGVRAAVVDNVGEGSSGNALYVELPYDIVTENLNSYLHLKTGGTLALARLSYEDLFSAELNLQGLLSSIFQASGGSDCIGFDGAYGLMANFKLNNKFSFHFGLHHFSGHYADEFLEDVLQKYNIQTNGGRSTIEDADGKRYSYVSLVQYVRDNSWLMGFDIEAAGFNLYFEAELPRKNAWVRPFAHTFSAGEGTGGQDTTLINKIGTSESYSTEQIEDAEELMAEHKGYRAWRLQTGLEYRVGITEGTNIFLAFDSQFFQEGKTSHKAGEYKESNPWDIAISAGGGIELEKPGRTLRVIGLYHSGRLNLLNFYYTKTEYFSVGFSADL